MSAVTTDGATGRGAGVSSVRRMRTVAVLGAAGRAITRAPSRVLLGLLWVYQRFVSPLTPPTCRYYPSCSQYAVIAVRRHGAVGGTWLTVRRLARCHPWAAGGVDDVPDTRPFARGHHETDGHEHDDHARTGGALVPVHGAATYAHQAPARVNEAPARAGGSERARSSRR